MWLKVIFFGGVSMNADTNVNPTGSSSSSGSNQQNQTVSTSSSPSMSSGIKYTITGGKTGGYLGIGATKGKEISLTDQDGRTTTIFARNMADLTASEIKKKSDGIALEGSESEHTRYVPIKLNDQKGAEHIFLVRIDRVLHGIRTFGEGDDPRQTKAIPPHQLVNFLETHKVSDADIQHVIQEKEKKGKRPQTKQVAETESSSSNANVASSSSSSGSARTSSRHVTFANLREESVYHTAHALKITAEESKQIQEVLKVYKNSDEWKTFQKEGGFGVRKDFPYREGFHLRRGVIHVDGKEIPLPLSLLIAPEIEGKPPEVEVLIKGKLQNVRSLRLKGTDMTIKNTFDLTSGKMRVQYTYNANAAARMALGLYYSDTNELIPTSDLRDNERVEVEKKEKELIEEKAWQADLLRIYSGFTVGKITYYDAKATSTEKVEKRIEEGKPLREKGDLILSYTAPEGKGDLLTEACYTEVRGSTNVKGVSPEFMSCLTDTGSTVAKLHRNNLAHRDLKVDNLLDVDENGKPKVKVLDFGFCCRIKGDGTVQKFDGVRGTIYTMDPALSEMLILKRLPRLGTMSAQEIDAMVEKVDLKKADVFSLGCTYYELLMTKGGLTGITPYADDLDILIDDVTKYNPNNPDSPTLSQLQQRFEAIKRKKSGQLDKVRANLATVCPPALVNLLVAMMDPEPTKRPSMDQVIAEIAKVPVNPN